MAKSTRSSTIPPSDHAVLREVPELQFLAVDGQSAPYDPAFQGAIRALYGVASALHKRAPAPHPPPRLEAVWWWGHGRSFPQEREKGWHWRLLLPVATHVDARRVQAAREAAKAKHPEVAADLVHLWRFKEGACMEMLHVGPYKEEGTTTKRLEDEVKAAGLEPTGLHHEIYLSDPRVAKPGNLRTILRQPVKRSSG